MEEMIWLVRQALIYLLPAGGLCRGGLIACRIVATRVTRASLSASECLSGQWPADYQRLRTSSSLSRPEFTSSASQSEQLRHSRLQWSSAVVFKHLNPVISRCPVTRGGDTCDRLRTRWL